MGLELRPTCEHCNKTLPPAAADARICSFECTFCAECAEGVLANACPNCGGNFVPRPIRPARNWNGDNHLGKYPPRQDAKYRPVDLERHRRLLDALRDLPADKR